jgi:hypothetical protein
VAMARPQSATPDPLPRSRVAEAATDLADLAVPVGQQVRPAPGPVGLVVTARVGPVGPVDPVARATTDPAVRVDRVITDPVARVDRVITDLVDRVGPDSMGRAAPVVLAPLGTAMTTAATSTALRGATDRHPGVGASRHGRHGTGHFRRRVDRGTTARSTTGATRKRLSGTRNSISSVSTSSEFGSRCKEPPLQTPASPIGGAGVALSSFVAPIRRVTVCPQPGAAWARLANLGIAAEVERYPGEMAMVPSMQAARALTVGLVSAGVLVGVVLGCPAGPAWASRHFDLPAFEEPAPPSPPDPMPQIEGPANQAPANQAPTVRHRRPLDDPSIHR